MHRLILILLLAFSYHLSAQKPKIKNGFDNFVAANTIYPMYALDHCIDGTVEVAFKLSKTGQVTYATVTKGIGADLDAEALRLIKLTSGKWELPVAYDTKFLIRSPIKFTLKGYGCEELNPASIGLSLNRYRTEMLSIDKITTYYKNKELGLHNLLDAAQIAALKNELEIDEDFFSRKITIAEKKIKQGDLQSACEDFKFVKYLGAAKADELIAKYCK